MSSHEEAEEDDKEILFQIKKNEEMLAKISKVVFNDNVHDIYTQDDDGESGGTDTLVVIATYPTDTITDISVFDNIPEVKDVKFRAHGASRGIELYATTNDKFAMSASRFKMIQDRERLNAGVAINGTVTQGEQFWVDQVSLYMIRNFPIALNNIYAKMEKGSITITASLDDNDIYLHELKKLIYTLSGVKNVQIATSAKNKLLLKVVCSLKKRTRDSMSNNDPDGT